MSPLPADNFALVLLVFVLGVKHGFDADHLATIDGLTRFNARANPRWARFCGTLFSLGHGAVVIAIALPEIPRVVRLVRSLVLTIREQPYIQAAQAMGTRLPLVLLRHVIPNLLTPLIVQASFIWASAMIFEAYLSFLGAGTPPEPVRPEERAPHSILTY